MHDRQVRLRLDAAMLALTAALVIAVAFPFLTPLRPGLALAAFALLPGAALLTLAPVDSFLTWCLVSVLVSLAVETLTSLILLWLHFWHPLLLASALGVISVTLLGRDLYRTTKILTSA